MLILTAPFFTVYVTKKVHGILIFNTAFEFKNIILWSEYTVLKLLIFQKKFGKTESVNGALASLAASLKQVGNKILRRVYMKTSIDGCGMVTSEFRPWCAGNR